MIRDGYGIITNYHLSTPNSVWYTTQETDEVIFFSDQEGNRRAVNNCVIFANNTNLLIQLFRTQSPQATFSETLGYVSDVIFIEAGG